MVSNDLPSNTICKQCGVAFRAKPVHIRNGWGKYCSARCHHSGMTNRRLMRCFTCSKNLERTPKQIRASKSGKFFCSKSCQTKWRNGFFVGPKHRNWKTGAFTYQTILRRLGIEEVCLLCREKDERVLVTHHRDEEHSNNDPRNLAWLCHNCHHLAHHDTVTKRKLMMVPIV